MSSEALEIVLKLAAIEPYGEADVCLVCDEPGRDMHHETCAWKAAVELTHSLCNHCLHPLVNNAQLTTLRSTQMKCCQCGMESLDEQPDCAHLKQFYLRRSG